MQRKLQLLIGGAALVMAAAIGLMGGAIADQAAAVAAFDRVQPAVSDVNSLTIAMATQQSSIRGFVATADETILQPYVDARAQASILFGRLERELVADDALVREVQELEQDLGRWQRGIEPFVNAARAGAGTQAAEDLATEGEAL